MLVLSTDTQAVGSNINYSNIHAASNVFQSQDQTDPLLVPTDPRLVRSTGEATILVQVVRYRLNVSSRRPLLISSPN